MSILDKFAGQFSAVVAAVMISAVTILGTVSSGPAFASTFIS